jgi:hypothetical protein
MDSRSAHRSGWKSTKLHLALIAIALLTVVYVFVVARTGEPVGFGELCVAVVSLVATTQGSRVAESFAQRPPPPTTKPVD